ncbi:hypothetical protein BJF95_16945 [Rhizobium oryziradicis]|uniref:Uncharacterized protein n=1 Tax=Rhizobium oryziradicis TaxID=1867956 RepID=A0A1Q8ZT32_9HYPH|nr:hypothetical protein BJF95_16945 [Rhizobium oryziradicis]
MKLRRYNHKTSIISLQIETVCAANWIMLEIILKHVDRGNVGTPSISVWKWGCNNHKNLIVFDINGARRRI